MRYRVVRTLVLTLFYAFGLYAGQVDCARADRALLENQKSLQRNLNTITQLQKALSVKADSLVEYGCASANRNDYNTFEEKLKKGLVEIPDVETYKRAYCGGGQFVLGKTIEPGSIRFLKRFLRDVNKKYGMEEVRKIINLTDELGYTLLDHTYRYTRCGKSRNGADWLQITKFLKKIGGKTKGKKCPNLK